MPRQQGVDIEQHLNRLIAHVGGQNDREVAQHLVDRKRVRVQLHLAGLDLGEIQHLVEQAEQGAGRTFALGSVVFLSRGELGLAQQREHAQNRVHWRADFVAHIGQKLALGKRCGLRRLGGLHQLCDVGADGDVFFDLSLTADKRGNQRV